MDDDEDVVRGAYEHSLNHGVEISRSTSCGCFYCLEVFDPSEIWEWLPGEKTAFCPRCNIDAVIGDLSGFPIGEKTFLRALRKMYFKGLD